MVTENEIDEDAFRLLEIEDLRELIPGKVGPQRKIFTAIEELANTPSPTSDWKDHILNNFETTSSSTQWNTAAATLTLDNFSTCQEYYPAEDYDEAGKVILYIDNSNIFINTQKHAAKLLKLRHGIIFDRRCRIDVGKLVARATDGREVMVANLYGSEPPALDSVWKSIREKAVNVMTHKKSSWTHREKQIDTSLVADAVEGIMQFREDAGENRRLILFTGDKDMLTVVKKARQYGWGVDIWSYKASISNDIEREARLNGNCGEDIQIYYMDDYFKEFTFSLTRWTKMYIPTERSFVVLFEKSYIQDMKEEDKNRFMSQVVRSSTKVLRIPTLAQFLDDDYEMVNDGDYIHIPTSNRFGALELNPIENQAKKCIPMLIVCNQREGTHAQEVSTSSTNTTNNTNRPRYDFTKDVWSKKDEIQKSIPTALDIITYQQYKQNMPNCMADVEEEYNDRVELDNDGETAVFDDFVLVERKHRRTNQKYSDLCERKFRCRHGTKCQSGHSKEEKEYFKAHPRAPRHLYKTKLCTHALKRVCKYENKRYLCSYAHDFYECMCVCCGEIGMHWADECPKRINHV